MWCQLANAEEFQDDKSNGLLGEIFIRYISLHSLPNDECLILWITFFYRCNNVLYIISFHFVSTPAFRLTPGYYLHLQGSTSRLVATCSVSYNSLCTPLKAFNRRCIFPARGRTSIQIWALSTPLAHSAPFVPEGYVVDLQQQVPKRVTVT